MKIESVFDPSFAPYGRVVEGYALDGVLSALAKTPCPENVVYKPLEETIHEAENAEEVAQALFGGMPFQLGYCNGHNTKLNCLEYHRDSEFNVGTEDFILLIAKQHEIVDGTIDSSCVRAFRVPKGVMVECYATTLHYAPCHADPEKGFRVLIALPLHTNTDYRPACRANASDRMLWARNKWLVAHPDSDEAREGAVVGITGENIDIANDIKE